MRVMNPAIRVDYVSKQYRIGARQISSDTLRERLTRAIHDPFHELSRRRESKKSSTFWALKDISFEVNAGEVVGIIGRNGAGKSTLLKILSRITEPTSGRIELYGRVSSLLEVGTGFHPELTGRENIFLNGAVLGMRRNEIERKFDEIVAFAEIDQFLDTPVKRYSSGMYTRLAFAVAAHLEPEILLIDEVLAVGDAEFQAKCLGKMGEVAKGGRTVLYVSHNLATMANLCSRVVLLVDGHKRSDGPAQEVIGEYIALGREHGGEHTWLEWRDAPGNEKIRLHSVRIVSGGQITSDVNIEDPVRVEIEFWNRSPGARIMTSIHLLDRMKVGVLSSANMHSANLSTDKWFNQPHPVGIYRASCTLPGNFLNEGPYYVNVIVLTNVNRIELFATEVISFNVHDRGETRKEWGGDWLGVVRPKLSWDTQRLEASSALPDQEKAS